MRNVFRDADHPGSYPITLMEGSSATYEVVRTVVRNVGRGDSTADDDIEFVHYVRRI